MDSPSSDKKKHPRRTSAEDKELAELVHKVHLLCLLARGRIVDNACNDPLIQVGSIYFTQLEFVSSWACQGYVWLRDVELQMSSNRAWSQRKIRSGEQKGRFVLANAITC